MSKFWDAVFKRGPDWERYPEMSSGAFSRWLRAQRPPWLFFLAQPEMIQEQLAHLGDEYLQQCMSAGLDASEAAVDEETRLQRLATSVAQGLQNGPQAPEQDVTHTGMGGLGKRREAAERRGEHPKEESKVLFGKKAAAQKAKTQESER